MGEYVEDYDVLRQRYGLQLGKEETTNQPV